MLTSIFSSALASGSALMSPILSNSKAGAAARALAGLGRFLRRQDGVTTIEYGILAAGLAVIIGALVADGGSFSSTLSKIFENILDQLPQSSSSGSAG